MLGIGIITLQLVAMVILIISGDCNILNDGDGLLILYHIIMTIQHKHR